MSTLARCSRQNSAVSVRNTFVTDDNSRVHTVDLPVHAGRARPVSRWFHTGTSTWYVLTDSGQLSRVVSCKLYVPTGMNNFTCAFIRSTHILLVGMVM